MLKLGDTVAIEACRNDDVGKLQWCKNNYGHAILEKKNPIGKSPLHEAVIYSSLSCVDYLLYENVDANSLKRGDWTPLMLASTKNNLAIVRRLVEHGCNLKLINKDGWNCLHIAVRENYVDIVMYLLDADVSLSECKTKNMRTPLHTASLHGHVEMLELLLTRCSYTGDEVDSCGTTSFMDALRNNHIHAAHLLVRRREIDMHHSDKVGGRQAIHVSAQSGACRAIVYLLHLHYHHLLEPQLNKQWQLSQHQQQIHQQQQAQQQIHQQQIHQQQQQAQQIHQQQQTHQQQTQQQIHQQMYQHQQQTRHQQTQLTQQRQHDVFNKDPLSNYTDLTTCNIANCAFHMHIHALVDFTSNKMFKEFEKNKQSNNDGNKNINKNNNNVNNSNNNLNNNNNINTSNNNINNSNTNIDNINNNNNNDDGNNNNNNSNNNNRNINITNNSDENEHPSADVHNIHGIDHNFNDLRLNLEFVDNNINDNNNVVIDNYNNNNITIDNNKNITKCHHPCENVEQMLPSICIELMTFINSRSLIFKDTPLHLAVKESQVDMVRLLLVLGADVNTCDTHDRSPLDVAQQVDGKLSEEMLKLLTV